jgi:hypothetical protein
MQEHRSYLDYEPGDRAVDALMFAIYYSAASSLTEEECKQQFGLERSPLLSRFRSDTEKALTRADFLISEDFTTLQALVLYLVSVRFNVKSRLSWTLLGLAVRNATALGLNRESSFASLPPFQKEMRRRLWWQLRNADVQACFDRGSDVAITENSFDTRMPLHVDDEDFSMGSSVISARPLSSFTQMTLPLISFETIADYNRVTYVAPAGWTESDLRRLPEQKQYWVRECQRRLEDKYLRHLRGHLDFPLQWLARTVGDIVISIMFLLIARPLQNEGRSSGPLVDGWNVLQMAVNVLEMSIRLDREPSVTAYRWLFSVYVTWHALAVTLAELCTHTDGPLVQHAWTVVDTVFETIASRIADSNQGMLWHPIKKLMKKAQRQRRSQRLVNSTAGTTTASTINLSPESDTSPFPVSRGDGNLFNSSVKAFENESFALDLQALNWDPWALITSSQPMLEEDDTSALANWDDFVQEYQRDMDMM